MYKQLLAIACLLLVGAGCIPSFNYQYSKYDPGRDTYRSFSSGRYQAFAPGDRFYISDLDSNFQIEDVERYVEQGNTLMIVGFYGLVNYADDGSIAYISSTFPDDEWQHYSSLSDIPYYTVVDLLTGEREYYFTIDEMPSEYQEFATKPLDGQCMEDRTCYEKAR